MARRAGRRRASPIRTARTGSGRAAAAAVEVAREQVAALLPPGGRVIFTSGATEALNLAMRGRAGRAAGRSRVGASSMPRCSTPRCDLPGDATILPVDRDGLVDPRGALPDGVGLVAVMQVNNEIGTIQPVADLAERAQARRRAVPVRRGAGVRARCRSPRRDMIAISAHKFHGPKGIGALWVRDGVELAPQIHRRRAGARACARARSARRCARAWARRRSWRPSAWTADAAHVDALWRPRARAVRRLALNGSAEQRWHGNLNLRRDGLDVARLMSRRARGDVLGRLGLRQRIGQAEPRPRARSGSRPSRRAARSGSASGATPRWNELEEARRTDQ